MGGYQSERAPPPYQSYQPYQPQHPQHPQHPQYPQYPQHPQHPQYQHPQHSHHMYEEEDEWELDEAQEEVRAYRDREYDEMQQQYLNRSLIRPGNAGYAGSSLQTAPGRLQYPVIIPQRRPKARSRGFIRAYAPDLMRCGIDQPTFMAFLDGFDRATAGSPVVGAVHLAGDLMGLVPSAIVQPIALGVQITAGVYQEIQDRRHQNAYISKMNDELFRPRGLYCLIMAYSVNFDKPTNQRDFNSSMNARTDSRSTYRSNDGMSGGIEFPVSAELVFPDLEDSSDDEQVEQTGQKPESSMMGSLSKTFENLKDKRDIKAQRKYVRKNPTSALNSLMGPKLELTPKDLKKQARRLEKDERKEEKRERKLEKKALKHPERAPKGPKKRKIRQDILYMMIMNTPPREEMENAMREVGRTNMLIQKSL
ncbi:uncharacterized protein F4822DRAFT_287953 [Hypoxylon trugodes]|uniref:uncharacterized protein n=1 Tax=Hypoxylon trugodes TaxID=326681 RepID=UPI0021999AC3|nr:uncharacterized protein F4822DRAFT_287953 [Hypoxylon trugodes]KAI1387592.1 hypothetical protein F4822DRAFT_287953 [Hypoxylon trugodes]